MRLVYLKIVGLCASLMVSPEVYARGSHKKNSNYCETCERSPNGRLKRSSSATKEFKEQTGYKNGRPGYVIDHVVPLKRGGADKPSNMQWQTIESAKAKDKTE
jgi:hypothetical protein